MSSLSLMALGIVFNEWVLARTLSLSGALNPYQTAAVRAFDLLVFGLGFASWVRPGLLTVAVRRLSASCPRACAVLLGLTMAVGLVAVLEACFLGANHWRLHEKRRNQPYQVVRLEIPSAIDTSFIRPDPVLGFLPRAFAHVAFKRLRDGIELSRFAYDFDEHGRRVTPQTDDPRRTEAALFFGCSFTFGDGVDNDETLPAYFAEECRNCRVHNLAFSGYGPQQMLALLRSEDLPRQVTGRPAKAFYVFIDDHVPRAVVSMRVHNTWGVPMPLFEIDGEGQVVYRGLFPQARPWTARLYELLGTSQVVRFYDLDMPRTRSDHVWLTARLIDASRRVFRERFGSDEFWFVAYPGYPSALLQQLQSDLSQLQVRILDLPFAPDPASPGWSLPGDRHPSASTHRKVALSLAAAVHCAAAANGLEGRTSGPRHKRVLRQAHHPAG